MRMTGAIEECKSKKICKDIYEMDIKKKRSMFSLGKDINENKA